VRSIYLSLLILLLTLPSMGQERSTSSKEIRGLLDNLKAMPITEYRARIDEIREKLEWYLEYKQRVCNSVKPVDLFDSKTGKLIAKRALTTAERKVCFDETRYLYNYFQENVSQLSQKYADYLKTKRGEISPPDVKKKK